jgi:phosphoglycolate phosphatase
MIKYIIFDFDGTLVDSSNISLNIFNEFSRKMGLRQLCHDEVLMLKKKTLMEKCKHFKIPLYKIPSLANQFYQIYNLAIKDLELFDGIKDLLIDLKNKEYELAIISSNSKENINYFLKKSGLQDHFQILSSNNIFGKDLILKKFLRLNKLKAEEVIYVGDEHRDIVACKKCGIKIIWVGWGYECLEAIQLEKPDYIVYDPLEITRIFN